MSIFQLPSGRRVPRQQLWCKPPHPHLPWPLPLCTAWRWQEVHITWGFHCWQFPFAHFHLPWKVFGVWNPRNPTEIRRSLLWSLSSLVDMAFNKNGSSGWPGACFHRGFAVMPCCAKVGHVLPCDWDVQRDAWQQRWHHANQRRPSGEGRSVFQV